ncbi:MAG: AMP-dependent synthetase and ligase [Lacunisphaera sp.]|nr:AMP-dependent synthetase and ligase [Lacunisphaera sp.]
MLIQQFLEKRAAEHPDKVALVCGAERVSYGRLDRMADQLAHALREQGVQRGDRVGIYLNNSVEATVAIFAVLKADGVFVVLSRTAKAEKVIGLLSNCHATAAVTDARAIEQGLGEKLVREVASLKGLVVCGGEPSLSGNGRVCCRDFAAIQAAAPPANGWRRENIDLDLACLIYTSGTTGEAKGVMCDHSNVVFVTQSIVNYLKNRPEDIILNVLPLASSYGLYQLMAAVCSGATLVLEASFAYPDLILERMTQEQVTGFAAVPTIYALLLGLDLASRDLSALRYLTNAGAGLPVEHVKRLRQSFPKADLYLMHGMTEVARTMYLPPEQADIRPASSGIPIPGTELWVEDENGRRLGPGEAGELIVRGRNVMRGYWMAPELTRQRFRPGRLPGERVCHSGDLFRTDEEGYFYFVSRRDDIIKSRGEKVAPCEVENVLYTLPGVREAAVIGVPDPILGQAIKAVVVVNGSKLTEAEVIAHCKTRLEYFMVPRHVEFRAELPKTGSGKIMKQELS